MISRVNGEDYRKMTGCLVSNVRPEFLSLPPIRSRLSSSIKGQRESKGLGLDRPLPVLVFEEW